MGVGGDDSNRLRPILLAFNSRCHDSLARQRAVCDLNQSIRRQGASEEMLLQ